MPSFVTEAKFAAEDYDVRANPRRVLGGIIFQLIGFAVNSYLQVLDALTKYCLAETTGWLLPRDESFHAIRRLKELRTSHNTISRLRGHIFPKQLPAFGAFTNKNRNLTTVIAL
jgi:hypothetical protein